MKNLRRKIFISILTVMICFITLGTTTFAWFSMNNKVTVTGMQVRTQTGDNLLIASSDTAATTVEAENSFTTALTSTLSALLEPVSTVDGVTFFYNATNNVAGDGNALADTYITYNPSDTSAFNTNYGTSGAVGYVDYAFQLKAINTSDVAKNVVIETLNLTYGTDPDVDKAFRVAVFVNDMGETGTTAATAPTTTSLLSILRQSGATYFTTDMAVSAANAAPTTVNDKIDDAATIGTVNANKTNYFKVVVRLWLEGEDSTCNNTTFATLNDAWQLDVKVKLADNDTTDGITNFSHPTTTTKVNLSTGTVANDAAATIIAGVSYYPITGNTSYYATAIGPLSASSRIYQIIDNKPIDVTNQCTLPNA